MGKYLHFKPVDFSQFNTAEYLDILTWYHHYLSEMARIDTGSDIPGAINLAMEEGVPKLGITPEMTAELDLYIAQLTELNAQSRAFTETDPRKTLDKQRTNLVSYITSRIVNVQRVHEPDKVKAANSLYLVTKPYTGIVRAPLKQRSMLIKGMVHDLRKDEYKEAIKLLDLEPYVDQLAVYNKEYIDMTGQMSDSRRASKDMENSKTIRTKATALLEDIMDLAFAWSLVEPSDEKTTFIKQINNMLEESLTALRQRRASKKEDKPGEGGDSSTDTPGPLENA